MLSIFLSTAALPCSGETTPELDDYIQLLHRHRDERSFMKISDDFREHLKKDINGTLIRKMLADKKLCGMLYANSDAAPDKYADLILAAHLVDDSQWNSQGGLFRSPSWGVSLGIDKRFAPEGFGKNIPRGSLAYVLDDKDVRSAISKALLRLYTDKKLLPEQIAERKTIARDEIVALVNGAYGRLLEEDNVLREKFRKEKD